MIYDILGMHEIHNDTHTHIQKLKGLKLYELYAHTHIHCNFKNGIWFSSNMRSILISLNNNDDNNGEGEDGWKVTLE